MSKRPEGVVTRVREETRRYIQELLREVERLRELTAKQEGERERLREERMSLQEEVLDLRREMDRFREERQRVADRIASTEEMARKFSREYEQIEEQNNLLASLYVAVYRLHSTPDRAEMLAALREVVINLIGSEEFAVFELEPDSRRFELATSFGLNSGTVPRIDFDAGPAARAIRGGEPWVADDLRAGGADHPLVFLPLRLSGRTVGLLVIFRLLPQKQGLGQHDFELFDLLASQAAMAFYASRLHHRAQANDVPVYG